MTEKLNAQEFAEGLKQFATGLMRDTYQASRTIDAAIAVARQTVASPDQRIVLYLDHAHSCVSEALREAYKLIRTSRSDIKRAHYQTGTEALNEVLKTLTATGELYDTPARDDSGIVF